MGSREAAYSDDIRGRIGRVVVPRERIAERVGAIAGEIAQAYADRELTILAVLTGSLIFLADLIRELPLMMRLDVISVSSYPDDATTSRGPKLGGEVSRSLAGKHVLIVDDILDSGKTMRFLLDRVKAVGPASVRSCVLLRKRLPGEVNRPRPDFVGFELEPEFVVGYGLDYDNLYRNLPDLRVLRGVTGEEAV